jgi:hypothetical protein
MFVVGVHLGNTSTIANQKRHRNLLTRTSFHCLNTSNASSSSLAHTYKHSCVIEIIAMPAKASNNGIANHCPARPVENCSSNEISCMVIVSVVTINYNGRENIGEARKLDCIELVLSWNISGSSYPRKEREQTYLGEFQQVQQQLQIRSVTFIR